MHEAIFYGKKRVDCLESLQKTEEVTRKIIDARTILGLYYMQTSYQVESMEVISPIIELSADYEYKKRLSQIHAIEGAYNFFIKEDLANALTQFKKSISLSKQMNDYVTLVLAQGQLASIMGLNCEFGIALEILQEVIETIEKLALSKWGIAVSKCQQSFFVYHLKGDVDAEFTSSQEAFEMANQSGDILPKAEALICLGISYYSKRRLQKAVKCLSEGSTLCERIGIFAWDAAAHSILGEIYYEQEDYLTSQTHFRRAVELLGNCHWLPSYQNLNKIAYARSVAMTRESEIDLEALYAYISENAIKAYAGWMRRCLGEVLLNLNDASISDIEGWIQHAIELDRQSGLMFNLAKDYVLYSKYFRKMG